MGIKSIDDHIPHKVIIVRKIAQADKLLKSLDYIGRTVFPTRSSESAVIFFMNVIFS